MLARGRNLVHITPAQKIQKPGMVWQAPIPMYGFDDAPRFHFENLHQTMKEHGMERHPIQHCLWLKFSHREGRKVLVGMIKAHVDDLEAAGTAQFLGKDGAWQGILQFYRVPKNTLNMPGTGIR